MTPEQIAKGLTEAQRRLVLESESGAFGRDDEGYGTPVRGQQHRTARTLERLGIGKYTYSDCFECLYFNNQKGLSVRALIKEACNAD